VYRRLAIVGLAGTLGSLALLGIAYREYQTLPATAAALKVSRVETCLRRAAVEPTDTRDASGVRHVSFAGGEIAVLRTADDASRYFAGRSGAELAGTSVLVWTEQPSAERRAAVRGCLV
jgi:hypothetical protein